MDRRRRGSYERGRRQKPRLGRAWGSIGRHQVQGTVRVLDARKEKRGMTHGLVGGNIREAWIRK